MIINNLSKIKITILGTGTSQGVPVIGCDCEVCQSIDAKDKRLRVSILISDGDTNIVVDSGPDFRQQMLRADVKKLDAIIYTHQHNDHIIGLDDVRPFNFQNWEDMLLFATKAVQKDLKERFAYAFATENKYPGAPMLKLQTISKDKPFQIKEIKITPIEVMHGKLPVLGFRIKDFVYLTDLNWISEAELKKLEGVKILILDALHKKKHHSHFNLSQAMEMAERIGAKKTYFTHMSHRMGLHNKVSKELPEGIELAYDGLSFSI